MKKISVYCTDRQYDALMREAEDRGLAVAEVLRRVIDVWLDGELCGDSGAAHAGQARGTQRTLTSTSPSLSTGGGSAGDHAMQECPGAREPQECTLAQLYEAIDGWMANYREACPDDPREDLDILLDATVYHAASPYWPCRVASTP